MTAADVLLPGEVIILRTCNADLTSKSDEARGFRWPESGAVACKDWDPSSRCGGGLHGLLWGCGDGSLLDWSDTAKGLAVAVPGDTVVGIDKRDDGFAKVKFPAGRVLFVGSLSDACKFIFERVPDAIKAAMVSGAASATRDSGAASATGYSGAASATGNNGAASATGDRGAASATGYKGAASATGHKGAASATGVSGAASATGHKGAASATGDSGAASATGYRGAASATGDKGAASATGYSGAVRGSLTSTLTLRRWDGKRYRIVALYPGEDGIKPLVWYRLNENGQPEEVPAEQCPKFATEPTNG